MTSAYIEPIANAIRDFAEGLDLDPNLKAYTWAPSDLDQLPALVVGIPSIRRPGLDESETQIGWDDWNLDFPVTLTFEATSLYDSQAQAAEFTEAFIEKIDANPTLGVSGVDEARVVTAEPTYIESDQGRKYIVVECSVQVLRLVQ